MWPPLWASMYLFGAKNRGRANDRKRYGCITYCILNVSVVNSILVCIVHFDIRQNPISWNLGTSKPTDMLQLAVTDMYTLRSTPYVAS